VPGFNPCCNGFSVATAFLPKTLQKHQVDEIFLLSFLSFPPHFAAKNANFSPVLHRFYNFLCLKINNLQAQLPAALIIFRQQIRRFVYNPCCNGFNVATVRNAFILEENSVSILVVMDLTLQPLEQD
jgi:alanine racemase